MTTKMSFFQRSAFSVQRSAFSVQRSAFSVQRSAFSVLLLFSFWFLTNQSYAQNPLSCGFTMTPEERVLYKAVITQMQNTPESSYPNIASNASIPLYFWINMGGPSFAPTALELQKKAISIPIMTFLISTMKKKVSYGLCGSTNEAVLKTSASVRFC